MKNYFLDTNKATQIKRGFCADKRKRFFQNSLLLGSGTNNLFFFFFKFRLAPHSSTHHIPHSSLSLSGRQCALQHFAHCGVYIAELGHHFFLDSGQCLAQRSGNVVHQALAPSIIQLLAEEEKIYIKKIMDKKWLSGH